jgi:hypothetical protein
MRFNHRVSENLSESVTTQITDLLHPSQPSAVDQDELLAVQRCNEIFTRIQEVSQKGPAYEGLS